MCGFYISDKSKTEKTNNGILRLNYPNIFIKSFSIFFFQSIIGKKSQLANDRNVLCHTDFYKKTKVHRIKGRKLFLFMFGGPK